MSKSSSMSQNDDPYQRGTGYRLAAAVCAGSLLISGCSRPDASPLVTGTHEIPGASREGGAAEGQMEVYDLTGVAIGEPLGRVRVLTATYGVNQSVLLETTQTDTAEAVGVIYTPEINEAFMTDMGVDPLGPEKFGILITRQGGSIYESGIIFDITTQTVVALEAAASKSKPGLPSVQVTSPDGREEYQVFLIPVGTHGVQVTIDSIPPYEAAPQTAQAASTTTLP